MLILPVDEHLLTVAEFAKAMRIGKSTVYRWIRLHQIQYMRLPSGTFRIPKSELDKIRQQLEQEQ